MELPNRLHALAAEIDGVANIYPPRSLLARGRGWVSRLASGEQSVCPVVVTESGDAVTVMVRIGVDLSHPAPAVAETVATAIETEVRQTRSDVSSIDVSVQVCAVTSTGNGT